MDRVFSAISSRLATWMGQGVAFALATLSMALWFASGPLFHWSDTWQLIVNTITNVVTFLMVFLIQNSQNRDGAAIQAKLDELLRADEEARSQFIGIEHLSDQQLEQLRTRLEEEAGCRRSGKEPPSATVDELLKRI